MSARRRWAWPLVPVYGAALAAKDALRSVGLAPARRLGWPIISVGSIAAGGAGKTPVAIALAKLLTERGWGVDVLSRGYGRTGGGVELVDPNAEGAARRFGDEPVLIAQRTSVPVWVGANRLEAGRAAERAAGAGTAAGTAAAAAQGETPAPWQGEAAGHRVPVRAPILDDGLQHRSLARQFELVVATAEDLRDTLLPAGNLREPLSALRRADAFAVREDELDQVAEPLQRFGGPEVPLWTIRRTLRFPAPLGVFGAGLRPLAFCALARPESFATMLAGAGCGVVDTVVFPDHHRYEERDLQTLIRVARQLKATGLVTSEKDAVKLLPAVRTRLEGEIGPLMVVSLQVSFVYESPVVRALVKQLQTARAEDEQVEARVR